MSRKITIEFLGDSKDLQKAMGDAESKSSKLSGTLGNVGKAAAVGLGAGIAAGAVALVGMTKNAIEDDAAQRKLALALKNTTGATDGQVASVEDWITAQGKALGVTDDELRPAFQRLVESTGSIEEAQRQMSIAMDVSAGTGKSLKTVSEALMKANNGTTASLSKLGLKTKDAQGNTLSLEDALKSMSQTFEGQASAKAETLQGKMDRLKLIFDETKETIGAKLIPILTNLGGWMLETGIPALGRMAGFVQENSTVFKILGGVLAAVTVALAAIGVATSIYSAYTTIAAAAAKVFAAGQWLLNAALTANPIGLVIVGLVALGAGLVLAYKKSETFRDIVTGALDKVRGAATALGNFFTNTLPNFFRDAWDKIKNITLTAIGLYLEWYVGLPIKIGKALGALVGIVGGLFRDAMDAGKQKVVDISQTIIGWIADIPGKLREKIGNFKDAGAALIGGFVDGIKNAGGVIEGIAGNVWNAVRTLLNGAISKINAALVFTINLPGKDLSINVPDIPHLAKGGIVNSPTLALIGEDGPEAVVPLSRKHNPGGVMPGGGGGGNIIFNISGALDPASVAKQIETLLIQRNRQVGPLAFVTRTT